MTDERDVELAELLAEVRRIQAQSSRLVRSVIAGGYSSVFRGAGVEFDAVREYVPGDDPRAVDWNVTARIGRPFVKKYVDERDLSVLFLLDLSPSMGGGFGAWSARQAATRLVACLALSAVQNDDKVGLIAFGDRVEHYVPAQKGLGSALRIVRDCLALGAAGTGTDAAPALDLAARVLRRRAILFLVSDFLGHAAQAAIGRCARRHDLVAVHLLVPELHDPGTELMRLRDPETGSARVADWRSPRVRGAYRGRVERWRARTAEWLRMAGVDRIDVRIPRHADPDAIARPILRFFSMRELRGAKR